MTSGESPRHAEFLATKDFVPKPEVDSFKTAWTHKSTFFRKSPLSPSMYRQINKSRSGSQEQNALLKIQNPGNVGIIFMF